MLHRRSRANLNQRLWRQPDDKPGSQQEPIGNIQPAEAEERYYAMLDEQKLAA